MMRRIPSAVWFLAVVVGFAGPAAAQVPTVGFVFPSGAQAGAKATVNVSGGNLQGATALLVSGEGVKATITKNAEAAALPVDLEVAAGAQPGLREVRVVTPRGTSNAGRFWVGGYPEASETEPNNNLATATKLEKLPITVNGQINGAEDADFFSFQAAAGDTYVFDLVAYRMASGLDGYLALYDARGKVLQSTQEPFDRDPRLIHTFKTAGTYLIQVRDSMYRGGANFVYALTLGKIPAITGYLPRGGRHGQTVTVNVEGVNLGSMKSMPVQIPMDREQVEVLPTTPMGPATSAISLVASDMNEVVEAEPNDTPAQATPIGDAPIVVNGRIDRRGDVDCFRFKPSAAGNLSFEIFGRRLGSKMDPALRILDPSGKQLQENDDADGKDSRIVMGVQAGTEYIIEVSTKDQNYGGDSFYRLAINPPGGQDFRLTVTPDTLNVGQACSTLVTVNVQRLNGFGGPVALRIEGLPAGITASPAAIAAGAPAGLFTLTADAAAMTGAMGKIRVLGTAKIGDKDVERVAQANGEGDVRPLEQPQPNQPLQQRATQIFTATTMPPTPYALTVAPEQRAITVKRGQSVMIKVTAIRQMGQTAQITLTVAGQPANVNPALQNVNANANEATITLNVAATAPLVTQNVIITGTLNNNVQVAPAISLTITE